MAAAVAIVPLLAGAADARRARPVAPPPPPPLGDLVLDATHPIIAVAIAGVPLRLRVDPGEWGVVELNPTAAHRLPKLQWSPDRTMLIGRVTLHGTSAAAPMAIEGRALLVIVAEHGREATPDADGVIGPDLLPYAGVVWRREGAPVATGTVELPLGLAGKTGLSASVPGPDGLKLHFSLMRPMSEGTAAAGSLLAQRYGGRFEGEAMALPVLFGVDRPARTMRFDSPPLLAGFRITRLPIRISDFRGENPLPSDPSAPGEIVVAGKDRPQEAEAWVTLAEDRLRLCAEVAYRASPRALTLSCVFDR